MTIRLRTILFIVLIAIVVWFLYLEREILTPFILAGIFAYIFNPIVNFITRKLRIPRTVSILIIYLIIFGAIAFFGTIYARRIFEESSELGKFISTSIKDTRNQINTFPEFIRPIASDSLIAFEKSRIFTPTYWVALFPQAISRIISFFLFLVAGFYFLKEGNKIFNKILNFIPLDLRLDTEILLRKMNSVFARYLQGQVFLIVLVSVALFIGLSILGVKFALLIAIFSGFAEIVPVFGPIIAGALAAIIVLISGTSNFPISNLEGAIAVVVLYFALRQLEDYFVIPHVMGKIADLHPLLILFAVLAGGHLFGILGLVLAVPIAGAIKILVVFSMDKINHSATKKVLGKQ